MVACRPIVPPSNSGWILLNIVPEDREVIDVSVDGAAEVRREMTRTRGEFDLR